MECLNRIHFDLEWTAVWANVVHKYFNAHIINLQLLDFEILELFSKHRAFWTYLSAIKETNKIKLSNCAESKATAYGPKTTTAKETN